VIATRTDDVERLVNPTLRVALQMVMPGTSGSVWGSRAYHVADEGIAALAGAASYGGPLDPITPGSRERWMDVLRELITIELGLAATAARLWHEAQLIRPSPDVQDSAWAAHVIAVVELLRGNVVGAERWLMMPDAATDPQEQRTWIADTCARLGVALAENCCCDVLSSAEQD
jgi:hypothetical protein